MLNLGDHYIINIVRDPQDTNCVIVLSRDSAYRIDTRKEKIVEQISLTDPTDIDSDAKTIAIRTNKEILSGPSLSKLTSVKVSLASAAGGLIRLTKGSKVVIDNLFGVQIFDSSLNEFQSRILATGPLDMEFSGDKLIAVRNDIEIFR